MTNSFFLGQVMGLYLVVMAIFLLVKGSSIQSIKESIQKTPALMVFSGAITLILGLLVVLSHNVWVFDWPVVITLFGYLMILAGLIRLFIPEIALKWFNKCSISVWAIAMLIIGLWLTIAAFQLV